MIFELAIVEDRGSYWQVTNVTKSSLDALANRNEKILKLTYMAYQRIVEALADKKVVHIPKSIRSDEVAPGEVQIMDPSDVDPLKSHRDAVITKARMLVTPELAKISGFALYGFTVLNNDMINAGFAITNDNREEKYLEILETGDEGLIAKLEDYLNYKDELERVAQLERKFAAFQRDVNHANDEEIDELETKFLEDFYKNF
jgi:hypothetical protein